MNVEPWNLDSNRTQTDLAAAYAKIAELRRELAMYERCRYFASMNRMIFHREGCRWLEYVPHSKRIEFETHEEAVRALYKPCKTCRA